MTATLERPFQAMKLPNGETLAYDRVAGSPDVVFLHGLHSDRAGTKALALEGHARSKGYGFIRFDMFGHGASSGRFEDGTISRWSADALAVIDNLARGPLILIGSSMGGWVMLKAAVARPERVAGLIGIAAVHDFTEDLIWAACTPAHRRTLNENGHLDMPSEYDETPYRISRRLIEDGRANLLLNGDIRVRCPVRLLQGKRDTSVPWQTAERIAARLTSSDVAVTLIEDGDHRLSRAEDLALLGATLDEVVQTAGMPMKPALVGIIFFLSTPAWSQTAPDPNLDDPAGTYLLCLDTARAYPERGLELAGKWIGLGAGEPGKHCRAIALIGLKEYAEAASSLEEMAADSKRPAELRAGLLAQAGQAWFLGEDLTKADAALTAALKLLPGDANLLVDRAEILADAGKYWEAIDDLNNAIAKAPSSVDAFAFRASAYRMVDAPDLAMEDAERAVALDSTHLGALLERGILFRMQNRPDDAHRDWMRIFELAPDSDAARSARANIEKLDFKPGN